jgi:hypothetical protein
VKLSTYSSAKMSFHYFETAGHATVYNQFRPRPPVDLVKRMVDFLLEKVSHHTIRMGINFNPKFPFLFLFPDFDLQSDDETPTCTSFALCPFLHQTY